VISKSEGKQNPISCNRERDSRLKNIQVSSQCESTGVRVTEITTGFSRYLELDTLLALYLIMSSLEVDITVNPNTFDTDINGQLVI